ncbi:IS630 family transposase [Nostoc sp. CHAB 5784]|uniref:IS630 family transposase n=1 Tax=Nostoc mirabile TaxID=2907820 RepID=UPI0027E10D8B|nr:IS630 family transposase [Nostoc mirabile]MCC5670639.1 IS630 family transposase [Nostoc mirabile CHAB5784]
MHASERYTERVQKLRTQYWRTIGEVNLADLVFIDEAGVNIAMTRLFARSKKGSRAYGARPDGRGKNVTMIGAMSLKEIIAAMTFQGSTDTNAFYTYVTQVLVPTLWPGACVVMDNFSSHKVAGIQEAIEAVRAKLVYLSPYSPDFSPIENCWSKVKQRLRSLSARTYEELDQAITDALLTVTNRVLHLRWVELDAHKFALSMSWHSILTKLYGLQLRRFVLLKSVVLYTTSSVPFGVDFRLVSPRTHLATAVETQEILIVLQMNRHYVLPRLHPLSQIRHPWLSQG